MTRRRGHNEGTIYERRGKDGRVFGYQSQLTVPGGKRRSFSGKTKRDVQQKLNEARSALLQGRLTASRGQTLKVYLDGWLGTVRHSIKPRTYEVYALNVRRIGAYLGHIRLDMLAPAHVQDYYNALLADGIAIPMSSPATKEVDMEGLPTVGVEVVVVEDANVLLMRRRDFDIWGLPGGYVEPGESMAEAALREVREETGLEIELAHLIGLYSYRHWLDRGYHFAAFMAWPIAGALLPQHSEALELRYCDPGDLPQPLGCGIGQIVTDALAGHRGVVRSHDGNLDGDYMDLIKQRDASGLSAREFYLSSIAPRLDSVDMRSELEDRGL